LPANGSPATTPPVKHPDRRLIAEGLAVGHVMPAAAPVAGAQQDPSGTGAIHGRVVDDRAVEIGFEAEIRETQRTASVLHGSLQYTDCSDWNRGAEPAREATILSLRRFYAGGVSANNPGARHSLGPVLGNQQAYTILSLVGCGQGVAPTKPAARP